MGQCYSVTLKIAYKVSEKEVVDALRKKIMNHEADNVRYSVHGIDMDNPPYDIDALINEFLPDDGMSKEFLKGFIQYSADFDCCYGWSMELDSMFEYIAPYLADGSYIKVYPDSGWWKNEVVDGKIKETWKN